MAIKRVSRGVGVIMRDSDASYCPRAWLPPARQRWVVSVVQAAPVIFDRERTLEKVRSLANEAARMGAHVVLFPEAFVSGYPKGAQFGSSVGWRTEEGRSDYLQYWDSAVDVPGPATALLGKIALENNIYLVIGVIERDGGTLYCCALFFDP